MQTNLEFGTIEKRGIAKVFWVIRYQAVAFQSDLEWLHDVPFAGLFTWSCFHGHTNTTAWMSMRLMRSSKLYSLESFQ
jgi:hypothetical protein